MAAPITIHSTQQCSYIKIKWFAHFPIVEAG